MNYCFDYDYHTTTYCHYCYGNLIPGCMVLFLPFAFCLPLPLLEKSVTTTPRFNSYYFYYDFDVSLGCSNFAHAKLGGRYSVIGKTSVPACPLQAPRLANAFQNTDFLLNVLSSCSYSNGPVIEVLRSRRHFARQLLSSKMTNCCHWRVFFLLPLQLYTGLLEIFLESILPLLESFLEYHSRVPSATS